MSWLIEDESIDRLVLDEIGGHVISGIFERHVQLIDDDEIETAPPVDFITLNNHNNTILLDTSTIMIDDDQESIRSGMTIIPSCSSSSMTTGNNHQRQQQVTIIQDASSNDVSMMNDSEVELSINPNSIDSSILTDFSGAPLISSVNSCESYDDKCDEEVKMDYGNDLNCSTESATSNRSMYDETKQTRWYGQFESEDDWDKFQENAKQLLEAVDCPIYERDELIAHLINLEEKMFWESDGVASNETAVLAPSKSSWLLEVIAISASIAVAGVVIMKVLKSR